MSDSQPGNGTIELFIQPRARDLGGFTVRRILPFMKKRTIGPFIFLDEMGPIPVSHEAAIDVRPHPHIGLSTVTYLFDGSALHRDSLGSEQYITPGAVNWMTAGRGIVHSERTPDHLRARGGTIHGLQSWVALPKEHEETAPEFYHHPSDTIPEFSCGGAQMRLICGEAFDHLSPVKTYSDMFYCDVRMKKGQSIEVSGKNSKGADRESGIYPVKGRVQVDGQELGAGVMAAVRKGGHYTVKALEDTHLMLLGGEPLDGPREIWWNFVSSSKERMEKAKKDWARGLFPLVPGDDKEFIPLPGE